MRARTYIGLAAVGGFLYLHQRRGGEMTLASMRDTLRDLFGIAKERAAEIKERTERGVVHDVASEVAATTEQPAAR